jgi:hypothetical protein
VPVAAREGFRDAILLPWQHTTLGVTGFVLLEIEANAATTCPDLPLVCELPPPPQTPAP